MGILAKCICRNFYWKLKIIANIAGTIDDIQVHVLSDNSGFYTTGQDSSNLATIWKFLFSTPTTAQCQQFPNLSGFTYGYLKLSDTSFFLLGYDPTSFNLHLYRATFSSTSPDWALTMQCSSGSWSASNSESILVSSNIYSFFIYGNPQYAYIASFASSSGLVQSSRYKSSVSWSEVDSLVSNGNNIIAAVRQGSKYNLVILDTSTSLFTIKEFAGDSVFTLLLESSTGR